ncbi:MAG TPA: helix-hairpin-helix domain-containing protein, partial [Rhodocyclaceae bacterium]|nr:helix-hairpin-helix domain-containing protein [Rhodocyclaceae bacterium]
PGIRTGVKVAVVDRTGKLVDTATIYPHEPRRDWEGALATLRHLAQKHGVELISIGNGTASRETDKLAAELMRRHPEFKLTKIVVSEAGASVYSASELAAKEFPQLDVSLRGAVSIARRLQDPLAELVKIDPKSIGVGQYQHDVNQSRLARQLDAVVEDCVNSVGVDVNTASAALLTRISGLNSTLANNIVGYRDAHGAFKSRKQLHEVPRLGEKTFVLAAGFLRINHGDDPLDASAVHPEAYPVVQKILADIKKGVKELIDDTRTLRALDPRKYADERFGLPTVQDILKELEKPGRDPRPEFKTASFKDGVEELKDLQVGMLLEGVVTNVTNFGAFIDIGVHQDGLAHVSALSNRFVKDPHEVVKAGDVVKVKVLEVDVARKRIALTLRLGDEIPTKSADTPRHEARRGAKVGADGTARRAQAAPPPVNNAMAAAFAKLKR